MEVVGVGGGDGGGGGASAHLDGGFYPRTFQQLLEKSLLLYGIICVPRKMHIYIASMKLKQDLLSIIRKTLIEADFQLSFICRI